MSEDLIKLRHALGLDKAVWLHTTKHTKELSVQFTTVYGTFAYTNGDAKLGSVQLNADGTCGGINSVIFPRWSPYDMSSDNSDGK